MHMHIEKVRAAKKHEGWEILLVGFSPPFKVAQYENCVLLSVWNGSWSRNVETGLWIPGSLLWELRFSKEESRRQQLEGHIWSLRLWTWTTGSILLWLFRGIFNLQPVVLYLIKEERYMWYILSAILWRQGLFMAVLFWNIVLCILLCLRECWSKMFALCSGFELGFTMILYFRGKTQFTMSDFLNVSVSFLFEVTSF